MAYINGLRSFGNNSALAAKQMKRKRESAGKWVDALAAAGRAHWLCRKAAELACKGKYESVDATL